MIAGVDEAGRGPVIGPLVFAGIAVNDEEKLKKLGVKDSKRHSPARREKLAEEIKKIAEYETLIITADEIDEKRKVMTINDVEVEGFAEIIKRLKPDIVYVDAADVDEERFKNDILRKLDFEVEIISKHKADDIYPVVSGASIIAKTTRDYEIEKIKEEIGVDFGSGYPSDVRTMAFLEQWVKEKGGFPPYTRKSWKTVRRMKNEKLF
ncbi:MAG: ribonuclease HII [Thermoplasmatales archaeon]|nr:ribonuclease HII [Candidatus Thermoplasmatota archaeon]MCG2825190.1 ribonuclease HII [Thermoplasmatales archaeon]